MTTETTHTKTAKKDNGFASLLINILIPSLILMKGVDKLGLTNIQAFAIALSFPIIYGLYALIALKKKDLISVLGFVSILITGLIKVFEFPAEYIAIKEAAIPLIIGIAIIITNFTSFPLVSKLLYNDKILNIQKIESVLDEAGKKVLNAAFKKISYYLALSFLFSAILNYILAKLIVVSDPSTDAFNEELGRMNFLSFPVIAVPSTIFLMVILWSLLKQLKKLTGLETEDLLNGMEKK